jgi:outer membrane murein-binding lipoprotein Lpp
MAFRKGRTSSMLAAAFGTALLITSCTCTIKEEQQAAINKARTDERQLKADIAKAESDKSRITSELNNRQAEVRRCNERKAFVQDKMAKWPNIWPDYDPNAQPAEDASIQKSTQKKKR